MHNVPRLTKAQAAATRRLNADLLALSRERRAFLATVRRMAWPVSHVPELWASHTERFLSSRRAPTAALIAPAGADTVPAPHHFERIEA